MMSSTTKSLRLSAVEKMEMISSSFSSSRRASTFESSCLTPAASSSSTRGTPSLSLSYSKGCATVIFVFWLSRRAPRRAI